MKIGQDFSQSVYIYKASPRRNEDGAPNLIRSFHKQKWTLLQHYKYILFPNRSPILHSFSDTNSFYYYYYLWKTDFAKLTSFFLNRKLQIRLSPFTKLCWREKGVTSGHNQGDKNMTYFSPWVRFYSIDLKRCDWWQMRHSTLFPHLCLPPPIWSSFQTATMVGWYSRTSEQYTVTAMSTYRFGDSHFLFVSYSFRFYTLRGDDDGRPKGSHKQHGWKPPSSVFGAGSWVWSRLSVGGIDETKQKIIEQEKL